MASATVDGSAITRLTAAAEPVILVNREIDNPTLSSVSSDD